MSLIIKVKCPFCGFEQNTTSLKTVKCLKCESRYQVFCKKKRSRVVGVVKGTKEMLFKAYYEILREKAKKKKT